MRVNVADTDEQAYEAGKNLYWQLGISFGIVLRHVPRSHPTGVFCSTMKLHQMSTTET